MVVVNSLQIPHELTPSEALNWFQKSIFIDIPPYFMTHWKTGKRFFYGGDALLAFEETDQFFVVAGEPVVAAGSEQNEILRSFEEFARRQNKKICGYYVGQDWRWTNFTKKPLGTSLRVPLLDFDLQASEAKEVRRALRKGAQLDYNVIPIAQGLREENSKVGHLYQKWRQHKAPFYIKFFLSQPQANSPVSSFEEWFIVEKNGEALAFCSLLPYLRDGELGFYVDHLVQRPGRSPYALSFLLSFLIEVLKGEGVSELNLGLNPFARIEKRGLMERLFSWLYHFPLFYRPRGIHFFKSKFTGIEEKEFCFFQHKQNQWQGLAHMAKATLWGQSPQGDYEC
jgi:lysylphosphatidylglycerol synthetase-like protein (DUF2156 family)